MGASVSGHAAAGIGVATRNFAPHAHCRQLFLRAETDATNTPGIAVINRLPERSTSDTRLYDWPCREKTDPPAAVRERQRRVSRGASLLASSQGIAFPCQTRAPCGDLVVRGDGG